MTCDLEIARYFDIAINNTGWLQVLKIINYTGILPNTIIE